MALWGLRGCAALGDEVQSAAAAPLLTSQPSHRPPPYRAPQAYFKMNNVLIDDRRIKCDFSQSVSHLWKQFRRHGRKGNADLGGQADTHQRGGQADAGRWEGGRAPAGWVSGRVDGWVGLRKWGRVHVQYW